MSVLSKPDDATLVAGKILRAIDHEIDLGGTCVARVSASIGISFCPENGTDAETLLRNADAAMYLAKKGGKNRYAISSAVD
jgi:diguanylate cyclase (GGDEF)-like protein